MKWFHRNNKHPHPAFKAKLNLSQKASDAVSGFFGSWAFILILAIVLFVWMGLNLMMLFGRWDPYPFILLNLVLSCLAAIQAPIILMSQNRQAERDRINAKYDYAVNRKAEREVANMQKDLDDIKALVRKKR
jgi:uncharacterized membrane protein